MISLIDAIGLETSIPKQEELLAEAGATRKTLEHLVDGLKNGTPKNRANAAWALGELKAEACFDALVQALQDEYWNARSNALSALFNIDRMKAKPYLETALNDPDDIIRENAECMLTLIA